MGKEMGITQLRNKYITDLTNVLEQHFDADSIITGSGELTYPITDEEGNEYYLKLCFSIPRGPRDGEGGYKPYNPYDEADAYAAELQEKQEKKEAAKRKKEREAEEKQRKREEKKKAKEAAALAKKLATKGLKGVIHEEEKA